MDYEKKYNEALERARKVHRNYKNLFPEYSYSEDIEEIFPELGESEDEKIRKDLIADLQTLPLQGVLTHRPTSEYIAYLEKQKEPENASASTIIPSCWEYEQKEQKPAEKQDYSGLNDLERAIHRGFLCAGVENVPVGIIKETAQDCLAHLPAEWSEEDKEALDMCLDTIPKKWKTKSGILLTKWLKDNIQPQPKQEWSEEEKTSIEYLNLLCDEALRNGCQTKSEYEVKQGAKNFLNSLKSLRPCSSWKPSEHQMTILKAVKEYVGRGSGYWGEGLGSLIEDLEKLM